MIAAEGVWGKKWIYTNNSLPPTNQHAEHHIFLWRIQWSPQGIEIWTMYQRIHGEFIHACMNVHTHIHTQTCTHTHTYTHTLGALHPVLLVVCLLYCRQFLHLLLFNPLTNSVPRGNCSRICDSLIQRLSRCTGEFYKIILFRSSLSLRKYLFYFSPLPSTCY